ncbi:SUGCT isoform 6, partial [Pongo abelii]
PSETQAMLATLAALRRTCLFSGRGGGRGLWTGRPQSESWRDLLLL